MSNDVHVLEELFHRANLLGPLDRPRFLEHACAGQPELRALVDRLLAADALTTGNAGIGKPGTVPALRPGQSVGRWRLIEIIGSGGMGAVYRASCQADGVTLEAALKILRPELGELLHEQFIQERLILAGIDHPYIARLIDAGVGPCGTSFMAMEFVEGLKLDQWLNQRKPRFRQRLQLFSRICEAVTYLHDNGIVHGDLKPSNVIVTPTGTPKLLDFGTARLASRSGSQSLWPWMTPAYASPEQLAGLGPSPEGDVYSLGCILEEMLENAPLCSDLTALLNKSLARPVNQRYPSPRALVEDVTRYLGYFPLRARRATPLYIAHKFLRRNRVLCLLATLFAVSLLLGWAARHNLMRARQYADERRSLVTSLVREDEGQRNPGARQRTAYAAAVKESIASMQRMQPPPFPELIEAWRRLSYSQASRGQTPESIASIEQAISWGRRYVQASHADDGRRQLAHSLLYAASFHQRRGDLRQAGIHALEAIQLADTLPEPGRAALERAPEYVRSLRSAARMRALSGDKEGARSLLVRAIGLARNSAKSIQLRYLLDLVRFERGAKQEQFANAWCAQALSLAIRTERLVRLCGAAAPSETEGELTKLAAIHERQLRGDPEKYGDRLQLARLELRLARLAAQKGDSLRAAERLKEAERLASELLQADPENRHVQGLLRNIRRGTAGKNLRWRNRP